MTGEGTISIVAAGSGCCGRATFIHRNRGAVVSARLDDLGLGGRRDPKSCDGDARGNGAFSNERKAMGTPDYCWP